ncbi:DUF4840 domain-containing protein [Chryseobacterium sp. OV279]|uniref:DUF4840 domain-containing protein n=1 Tax=Chryseobacterium sp. OV279 TaxID=1500285 RepID=UPI0006478AA2|nr:DUF4840 domain-containing protein [Chryseobacterium sp. OV279]SHG30704.1 protein of unknown function [Chryseobacterium sp. OV279]
MKNLIVLKVITTVLVISIIFSLFSCMNEDRIEVPPVKLENVYGDYKGRLITVQGESRGEKVVDFKIKKDTLTFPEFPIKEIVKAVVKDPIKTETALAAMGKVKYKLNYTSVLNAEKNWVELTFVPKELELQIPVDGVNKKAVVTLVTKQKGYFIGLDYTLRFVLAAEKITVDGTTVVSPFEAIYYNFPYCIRIN